MVILTRAANYFFGHPVPSECIDISVLCLAHESQLRRSDVRYENFVWNFQFKFQTGLTSFGCLYFDFVVSYYNFDFKASRGSVISVSYFGLPTACPRSKPCLL